ncbi:MAG: TrbC/VirB2 family protein [Ottowia sp.]|nr:TrbC/VirB2 family protein [Ottowia sp.]
MNKQLHVTVVSLMMVTALLTPELAMAQSFSPVTSFLRNIVQFVIFDAGYYIGALALAIVGYKFKAGEINMMNALRVVIGIFLVFFAPNLVATIRSTVGSTLQ